MEQYTVTGMSCAACSARVEKAVSGVEGVSSCSVNLLTNSMGVEGSASPEAIIAAVEAAGYTIVTNSATVMIHEAPEGWLEDLPAPDTDPDEEPGEDPDAEPEQGGGNETVDSETDSPASGVIDSTFAKSRKHRGAMYASDGSLVGVAELSFGKASRNGAVRVTGGVTLMNGKKVSAKSSTLAADGSGGMQGVLVFKAPFGAMDLAVAADGGFRLDSAGFKMVAAAVGGQPGGGARGVFRLGGDFDLEPVGELQTWLLPAEVGFDIVKGKWKFARNASVKISKDPATGEYMLAVDTGRNGDKTNVSAVKLTYTAKTGKFKGSFKVYDVVSTGSRPRLKKYTVNVSGFVLDGKGTGQATCKRPAGGPWSVTVE